MNSETLCPAALLGLHGNIPYGAACNMTASQARFGTGSFSGYPEAYAPCTRQGCPAHCSMVAALINEARVFLQLPIWDLAAVSRGCVLPAVHKYFKVATGPRCGINRKIREVLQVPPWRSWGSGHINHLLPLLSLEGLEGFAERQLGCGAPGFREQRSSPGLTFRVTMAPHLVGHSGWQIVVMTAGSAHKRLHPPRRSQRPPLREAAFVASVQEPRTQSVEGCLSQLMGCLGWLFGFDPTAVR